MTTPIFGTSETTPEQAIAWARARRAHERFLIGIPLYYGLAVVYDIPAEVGVAQAAHETANGHYGGVVPPEFHNWCGLKTRDAAGDRPEDHARFKSDMQGVEAHLQHLTRYGGRELPPGRTLLDPRWDLVTKRTQTVEGLGGAWAPSITYGVRVAELVRSIRETEIPMAGDDARFQWTPDEHEYGYPRLKRGRNGNTVMYLIVHTSEGTDSQSHLLNRNGNSTHYLTDRLFRPRTQHVREADAAWTAGHRAYNERGINVEFEYKKGQKGGITAEMYRNAAVTVLPIMRRHGIPPVYLGRDPLVNKPGQKGVIGHGDVPPPNDHTDPSDWDWVQFIAALKAAGDGDGGPALPPTAPDPWKAGNPYSKSLWIPLQFIDHIRAGDWMSVGFCVAPAEVEDGRIVQYFERARLELHSGGQVMRGLVGIEAMLAKYPDRAG